MSLRQPWKDSTLMATHGHACLPYRNALWSLLPRHSLTASPTYKTSARTPIQSSRTHTDLHCPQAKGAEPLKPRQLFP